MALDDIFRALEEQAQKEREDILSAARAQADAIAEDAAEQAEGLCAARVEKTETIAKLKAAKTMNAVRLEAKKQVASIKDAAVAEAFDTAGDQLASARASEWYTDVFRSLVQEAAEGVSGEVVLLVDPADADLAKSAAADLGIDVEVRGELSTKGGVAVLTGDGRIVRRNTFEDRLEKVRQLVQSDVAEILFS